jgi:fluoride ion exporter CrcB/FEX
LPIAKLSQRLRGEKLTQLNTTQVKADFRLGNVGANLFGGCIVIFFWLFFNHKKFKRQYLPI